MRAYLKMDTERRKLSIGRPYSQVGELIAFILLPLFSGGADAIVRVYA